MLMPYLFMASMLWMMHIFPVSSIQVTMRCTNKLNDNKVNGT